MKIKNFFLHIGLVNRHKFLVFKLCLKAGIPFRGLVHDLSKFSKEELFESVKYYSGDCSPIKNCKKDMGYSKAWLHHKGRNKHHLEYWYDYSLKEEAIVIPFIYVLEMICDSLAAGIVYKKDKWTKSHPLQYYLDNKKYRKVNPKIDKVLIEVYTLISKEGIDKVLNKKTIKEIYDKYVY